MTSYHGWTHLPKEQGGTDPVPFTAGADYCYMQWNGGEAVTVNTHTNPAILGTPDVPYEEGFVLDVSPFSIDLDLGLIEIDGASGWFLAEAWAQFGGGATVGSVLGVALDFGNSGSFSTYRVGNSIVAGSVNEVHRIPVSRTWLRYQDNNHDSIRLLVWHNDAGGQDLNSAYISVSRLNASDAGEFYIPS